jgi:hypothetical protein
MSGYTEAYREANHQAMLNRWAPPEVMQRTRTEDFRWWVARAKKAEHQLKELTDALSVINKVGR